MTPRFLFTDGEAAPWQPVEIAPGVEVKALASADGQTMELYRFAPNTSYPDHFHEGPEFVYMLEGEATQDGRRIGPGWASVGESGTLEKNFHSGPEGCLFLTVYQDSRYVD
ncbi:MAG: cupin domain-containing protein [Pseudomonadota bacterium]